MSSRKGTIMAKRKMSRFDRAQLRRELREWRRCVVAIEVQFRGGKDPQLEDKLTKLAKKAGYQEGNTGTWLLSGIREVEFVRDYKDREDMLRLGGSFALLDKLEQLCQKAKAENHSRITVQA